MLLAMLLMAQDVLVVQAGEGLKVFEVRSGALAPKGALATPTSSPIYLRPSPDARFLYAATPQERLLVVAVGKDGSLTRIGEAASPGGLCYVDVHPSGRWVSTANYGAGKTLLYRVDAEGKLGEPASFDTGPQTHSARFHPGGKHLFALSVGGRRITRFPLEGGAPEVLDLPELGPRHIAFSPRGDVAFVVHERPIRVSSLRAAEKLEVVGTWPALAPGAAEKKELAAAEIEVAPSGRFVYASVRDFSKEGGLNGLAVFGVEPSGELSWIEFVPSGGVSPRGFVIDPAGAFLFVLNEISGTLITFRIDAESGRLKSAGDPLSLGGSAIGIAWVRPP